MNLNPMDEKKTLAIVTQTKPKICLEFMPTYSKLRRFSKSGPEPPWQRRRARSLNKAYRFKIRFATRTVKSFLDTIPSRTATETHLIVLLQVNSKYLTHNLNDFSWNVHTKRTNENRDLHPETMMRDFEALEDSR